MKYAQDWAFPGGKEPEGEDAEDYRRNYSPVEQKDILKLVRVMRFANCWMNTLSGRSLRDEGSCCGIPVNSDEKK